MAEKAMDSGTQGKKNKVLKRPIDLIGINLNESYIRKTEGQLSKPTQKHTQGGHHDLPPPLMTLLVEGEI